jgi:putative transposase
VKVSSGIRRAFPSDLGELEWGFIKDFIPSARSGGRPRSTDPRAVVNAILFLNRTGCAWRYLPGGFPPWQTVYDYFSRWSAAGVWAQIVRTLTRVVRQRAARSAWPKLGIVDSQSVRAHYGEHKGWDGYKKVRGRKRHILVDSLGLLWSCHARAANEMDHKAAQEMFKHLPEKLEEGLQVLLGDGSYRHLKGDFEQQHSLRVETVHARRIGNSKHLTNIKPKRWIVERTFAWFNLSRRLSRDYERKTSHSESMVYTAMIPILLKRLAKDGPLDFLRKLLRQAPRRANKPKRSTGTCSATGFDRQN